MCDLSLSLSEECVLSHLRAVLYSGDLRLCLLPKPRASDGTHCRSPEENLLEKEGTDWWVLEAFSMPGRSFIPSFFFSI